MTMDFSPTIRIEPLSERESKLLDQLEIDIEQNLKGFKKVGYALSVIRDQRLYRVDFDTFEEYCHQVWDLGRPRAYQLMDGYTVMENLSTMVDKTKLPVFEILPANERQVRPLYILTPEQQVEAWTKVVEAAKDSGVRVTAELVQQCVSALLHGKVTKAIEKTRETITRKERVLPEDFQQAFTGFLDVVQREADANWSRVKREEMAAILREILYSIEE